MPHKTREPLVKRRTTSYPFGELRGLIVTRNHTAIEKRNSSKIRCARSISRQRATP